jgi:hypothetical protein
LFLNSFSTMGYFWDTFSKVRVRFIAFHCSVLNAKLLLDVD